MMREIECMTAERVGYDSSNVGLQLFALRCVLEVGVLRFRCTLTWASIRVRPRVRSRIRSALGSYTTRVDWGASMSRMLGYILM